MGDCTLVPNVKGQLPKDGVAAAEGRVAANNIAADLGGEESSFDGYGYCFEMPGRKVAFVEGNFIAEPELDVHITQRGSGRPEGSNRARAARCLARLSHRPLYKRCRPELRAR